MSHCSLELSVPREGMKLFAISSPPLLRLATQGVQFSKPLDCVILGGVTRGAALVQAAGTSTEPRRGADSEPLWSDSMASAEGHAEPGPQSKAGTKGAVRDEARVATRGLSASSPVQELVRLVDLEAHAQARSKVDAQESGEGAGSGPHPKSVKARQ